MKDFDKDDQNQTKDKTITLGGPGHHTRKTTHRAGTRVNRRQVAQDTAHAKQHTEQAHR